MGAWFQASAQCRNPTPCSRKRIPGGPIRSGQSAGVAIRIGSAWRSTRAHLPAVEVMVPRLCSKQSGLLRPCDPIGSDLGFREHSRPCSRAKDSLTFSAGRRSRPLDYVYDMGLKSWTAGFYQRRASIHDVDDLIDEIRKHNGIATPSRELRLAIQREVREDEKARIARRSSNARRTS